MSNLAKVFPIASHVEPPKPKRSYTRLTDAARGKLDAAITELMKDGATSKADYKRLAAKFNVSASLVEKRVAKLRHAAGTVGHDERVTGNSLPEDVKTQLVAHQQVKATWKHYRTSGEYSATYATFRRQVHNLLGANTVRGLTKGVGSMRRGTYEKLDRPEFMQGYSIDLFYLRAPLAGQPDDAKPVGALVCEQSTGVVVASWIWPDDTVTASDVMVLLAEAFRGRVFEYEGQAVFLGGVPDFLRCDNGGQFTAVEVGNLLNPLAVRVITSSDYRSHENGAHERKHGVLRSELLDLLPGSENGPRDHRKTLLPDPRTPVTLEEVRDLLDRWAWRYNTRDDNGDGSRMDAWVEGIELSDGLLPQTEAPAVLAEFAVERDRTARLEKGYGLLVAGQHYVCSELRRYAEKRFVVRQWLRDTATIEVFTISGAYVGTATRNGDLTPAESTTMIAAEREDEKAVKDATYAAREAVRLPELPAVPTVDASLGDDPADDAETDEAPGATGLSGVADALRRSTEDQS